MAEITQASSASRTAMGVIADGNSHPAWFRTEPAWSAFELIKLYQKEFGGDWKEFYGQTVRIEAPRG